jgi:CubicO group peptidase (beta-lactamase class C family)
MHTFNSIIKHFLRAVLLLCITSYFNTALAQSKIEKIDALMKHCYENGLFNGSIIVTEHGSIYYSNNFGFADKKNDQHLTGASQFYLASVSKQFTSMAIMILKEQGRLSFQDKLSKFFPDFPAYAKKVTIEHLMTHTSGIADPYSLGIIRVGLRNQDVLKKLMLQDSLEFEPGEKYSYSNGGYILLALIIEKVSGQSFSEFMNKYIFHPLKMDSTLVYDESQPAIKHRVIGYNSSGNIDDYNLFTYGAGGVYSTAEDLYKWDSALYANSLITEATLKKAFTPFKLKDNKISHYGYGWKIAQKESDMFVFHDGFMGGFRTIINRQLERKSTIIILTNIGDSSPLATITTAVENIMNDKNYDLPMRSAINGVRLH